MLENEFRVIGSLISYYRKIYKIHVNDFLVNTKEYYTNYCKLCNECNHIKTICSKRTLYRIEEGNRIRKDCYYIRLCENLDLDIVFEQIQYDNILRIRTILYQNLVDFNADNLEKILDEIERNLEIYNKTIYFKEILSLYSSIIQYKLFRKLPSNENISIFVYMKNKVSEIDKKLILYLIYDILFKMEVENYSRESLLSECEMYFDDSLFFRMKLTSKISNDSINGLLFLMSIEENNLNLYQRYCVKDLMSLAYTNLKKYDESFNCLQDCQSIIKEGLKLTKNTLINYYRKLGIISFANKKYDCAVDAFYKVCNEGNSLGANYALLFYSLEK